MPFASIYAARRGPAARFFGADAPLFARLLPDLVPPDAIVAVPVAPEPAGSPEAEKRRLFEAFARVFARLARHAPLLVVLEDLHWADEATLELLALLPRRLADARVLTLLTARSDEPGGSLAHWRTALTRAHHLTTLDLAPLTRADVAQVIAATVEATAVAAPPASVVTAIEERAEGNPFFVEELLYAWADARMAAHASDVPFVPASVRETVTHRLDALGEVARAVAEHAAVIGRQFRFGTLRTVTGINERALTAAMRVLVAAHLVDEDEGDNRRCGLRLSPCPDARRDLCALAGGGTAAVAWRRSTRAGGGRGRGGGNTRRGVGLPLRTRRGNGRRRDAGAARRAKPR